METMPHWRVLALQSQTYWNKPVGGGGGGGGVVGKFTASMPFKVRSFHGWLDLQIVLMIAGNALLQASLSWNWLLHLAKT